MWAADLCPAGTKPWLGLYLIFVVVPWPNRLSQPTERLPALGGQRAGSHLLELGSRVAAVRPEPGGLCPALCTVSGLQVSKLWLLSLPSISRKTAKDCTYGIAAVTVTVAWKKIFSFYVTNVVAGSSKINHTNDDLTRRGQTAGLFDTLLSSGTGPASIAINSHRSKSETFEWNPMCQLLQMSSYREFMGLFSPANTHTVQCGSFTHAWKWYSSCYREAVRAPCARTVERCGCLLYPRVQSTIAGSKRNLRSKTWSAAKVPQDYGAALFFSYDRAWWQASCSVPAMFHNLRAS